MKCIGDIQIDINTLEVDLVALPTDFTTVICNLTLKSKPHFLTLNTTPMAYAYNAIMPQ